ncbi:MAG: HYR domain-containing protein, partial [Sphingobacteriia bacterium]|nr:HYR domain-containing protein [Sphingobacteriia bacterium]
MKPKGTMKNNYFFSRESIQSGFNYAFLSLMIAMIFLGMPGVTVAQDSGESFITDLGETTICEGGTTTIQVIICAGVSPWTVVYSDGTNNYTINNYQSNCDPDDPDYGGDPIDVTPSVTTTYNLVSVHDANGYSMPIYNGTVTITVNPLPSNVVVSTDPTIICPGVDFDISATATNGSTFELWNQANTTKIGDMPYTTSITFATTYTVRAISGTTPACTTSVQYIANLENVQPLITCPGNQTINPSPANGCSAPLPDYRSLVTVSDNCTATGNIVLVQNPAHETSISGHNTQQQVTITATDQAGNSNSCNFYVTLIDNVDPQISCVDNQIAPAGTGCTYTHSGTDWDANASDNCQISSTGYELTGATTGTGTSLHNVTFQPGTTTVTWTTTDVAGRTASCSFSVAISDTEDPVITSCPSGNQEVGTNGDHCLYTHSGTTWDVEATDNCVLDKYVYELTGATTLGPVGTNTSTTLNGVIFLPGVTTVVWTVTDGVRNEETCSFTVTVSDDDNPTINCPTGIAASYNNDSGECTYSAQSTEFDPTGYDDNCQVVRLTYQLTGVTTIGPIGTDTSTTLTGVQFNKGTTTVTWSAFDAENNSVECSFTVTVEDNENPTITCPADITENNDSNVCNAEVTIQAITFSDNCPGSSIAWTTTGATTLSGNGQPGAQTFNVGVTTVTVTVTDAAENTATCSFTVTVNDTQEPTIDCPITNIEVDNDAGACSASVAVPAVNFDDNCSGETLAWEMTGATTDTGSGQIGIYTFNVGTTTVTYTVSDAASPPNTSQCSFTVKVNDIQIPVVLGCPSAIELNASAGQCGRIVSWTEPTAADNCTPSGSILWEVSQQPGTFFPVGTTTVTYRAIDASGNKSATCTFTVVINDNQRPVISGCPSDITVNVAVGTCSNTVTWTEPTATDNCTPQGNLIWEKSHLPGATFGVGTTVVTYRVKDESGNWSSSCYFNIIVNDNIPPTAVCKNATIALNESGSATLVSADVNNSSFDNCTAQENLNISLSKTIFNCNDKGENTIVVTVSDASGNENTCNAIITVEDNLHPTVTSTIGTVNTI